MSHCPECKSKRLKQLENADRKVMCLGCYHKWDGTLKELTTISQLRLAEIKGFRSGKVPNYGDDSNDGKILA